MAGLPQLVPQRIAQHRHYPTLVQAVRLVQFVSAVVSLGLFARYLATLGTATRSHADGAVVGIVAAAVVWVLVVSLIGCLVPLGGILVRLLVLVFDAAFVGAFIGVAALTSPGRGTAGQCPAGGGGEDEDDDAAAGMTMRAAAGASACHLVAGTFGLSIVSTFMHTLSALMQQGDVSSPAKINNPLSGGGDGDLEVAQTSHRS